MIEQEIGRMIVRLVGDTSHYVASFAGADKITRQTERTVVYAADTITNALETVKSIGASLVEEIMSWGRQLALFGSIVSGTFGSIGILGLQQSASMEQMSISFRTLIGDVREADTTLERLMRFADKTPFSDDEILEAGRALITFQERGDELMHTMEMLGNAAAGTSSDFGLIAMVYNQVRGVGKLLTQDFRQLSTRGVLYLSDIAKHFGISEQAASKMLSTGRIGFKDLKAILEGLSAEGGRFHNMMELQSRSLAGLWETFKGYVLLVLRDIGNAIAPVVKMFVDAGIRILKAWDALPMFLKNIVGVVVGVGFAVGTVATIIGTMILSLKLLIPLLIGAAVKFLTLKGTIGLLRGEVPVLLSGVTGLATAWQLMMMPVQFVIRQLASMATTLVRLTAQVGIYYAKLILLKAVKFNVEDLFLSLNRAMIKTVGLFL